MGLAQSVASQLKPNVARWVGSVAEKIQPPPVAFVAHPVTSMSAANIPAARAPR
jgi:hypothetical protein